MNFKKNMQRITSANSQSKELFCQTYWKNLKPQNTPGQTARGFHDFNNYIMQKDKSYSHTYMQKLCKANDLALRFRLKSLPKTITFFRGITNPDFRESPSPEYIKNLFQKSIKLKKNDTLYMPEYSFWSNRYALDYVASKPDKPGILYEITISEGAKIYDYFDSLLILKRASKFSCIINEKIIDGTNSYNHIKLELLPRNVKPITKKNIFQEIKSFASFLLKSFIGRI